MLYLESKLYHIVMAWISYEILLNLIKQWPNITIKQIFSPGARTVPAPSRSPRPRPRPRASAASAWAWSPCPTPWRPRARTTQCWASGLSWTGRTNFRGMRLGVSKVFYMMKVDDNPDDYCGVQGFLFLTQNCMAVWWVLDGGGGLIGRYRKGFSGSLIV